MQGLQVQTLVRELRFSYALWPKNQNIKHKHYCNKLNKDFKNGPHQKQTKIFKKGGEVFLWWLSCKESACQCRRHGFNPWSGKIPQAMEQLNPCATVRRKHADWNYPPWPGTMATICLSYFTTAGPGKEHGINKPPPTRRIQERSKGDVICPTTSQNPSRWHPSWLSNGMSHQEGP